MKKKLKPAEMCEACLGSGRVLPTEPPWDRFLPGVCAECDGLGRLGCVRLSTVPVGSVFAYANGKLATLIRRHPDGAMATARDEPGAIEETETRKDLPVRVVYRCDVAFFAPRAP